MTERSVIIVDDDPLVLEATGLWVASAGYNVSSFADPADFLQQLPTLPPGCVLLDMQMPGIDGVGVLEQAKPWLASHPVVVMTGHGDVAMAVHTMKLGAADFIEKPFRRPELIEVLELAYRKIDGLPADAVQKQAAARMIGTLTPREADVLNGLMEGLSNKAVARKLDLSPRTVEMHRANMMKRLGVRTLSEALKIGLAAQPWPVA
jgi:two-component system response regulator FixJ